MSIEKKMENMKKELYNNLYLAYLLNTYPEKTEAQARHLIPDLKRDRDGENLLILMEMELLEIMHRLDPHDLDIISPHDELKKKILASRVFVAKRGNVEETIEFLNNVTIESISGGKKIKYKRKQRKNTKKRKKPRKSTRKKKTIRKKIARKKSLKKNNNKKKRGGTERRRRSPTESNSEDNSLAPIPFRRTEEIRPGPFPRGVGSDESESASEISTIIDTVSDDETDPYTYELLQDVADDIDILFDYLVGLNPPLFHDDGQVINDLKFEDLPQRYKRVVKSLPDKLRVDGKNIFDTNFFPTHSSPVQDSIRDYLATLISVPHIHLAGNYYNKIIELYIESINKSPGEDLDYDSELRNEIQVKSNSNIRKHIVNRLNEFQSLSPNESEIDI